MTHEEFNAFAKGKVEIKGETTDYIMDLCKSVKGGLLHNGFFINKIVLEKDIMTIYHTRDHIDDDLFFIIDKYANKVREDQKYLRTGHTWLAVEDGHLIIKIW